MTNRYLITSVLVVKKYVVATSDALTKKTNRDPIIINNCGFIFLR